MPGCRGEGVDVVFRRVEDDRAAPVVANFSDSAGLLFELVERLPIPPHLVDVVEDLPGGPPAQDRPGPLVRVVDRSAQPAFEVPGEPVLPLRPLVGSDVPHGSLYPAVVLRMAVRAESSPCGSSRPPEVTLEPTKTWLILPTRWRS